MKRAKLALLTFSARRLFSTMSQRCRVRLQGIPDIWLASMAMVAVVPAQWQWMWVAPQRAATSANHNALGTTARFFRAIAGERPRSTRRAVPIRAGAAVAKAALVFST